jgi:uncharacterized protein (DUF1697 family)
MTRYAALLRGVNVGGKNKIPMPELKVLFEKQGFKNVLTYINSGNIIFDSDLSETDVTVVCKTAITDKFGLDIPVRVTTASELQEVINNTPDWWGNHADSTHDAIFVIPPMTVNEVCEKVGVVKPEYERAEYYKRIILWSAPRATFSRTRFSKIIGNKEIKNAVTIRNANTTRKILQLLKSKEDD